MLLHLNRTDNATQVLDGWRTPEGELWVTIRNVGCFPLRELEHIYPLLDVDVAELEAEALNGPRVAPAPVGFERDAQCWRNGYAHSEEFVQKMRDYGAYLRGERGPFNCPPFMYVTYG